MQTQGKFEQKLIFKTIGVCAAQNISIYAYIYAHTCNMATAFGLSVSEPGFEVLQASGLSELWVQVAGLQATRFQDSGQVVFVSGS